MLHQARKNLSNIVTHSYLFHTFHSNSLSLFGLCNHEHRMLFSFHHWYLTLLNSHSLGKIDTVMKKSSSDILSNRNQILIMLSNFRILQHSKLMSWVEGGTERVNFLINLLRIIVEGTHQLLWLNYSQDWALLLPKWSRMPD